MFPNYLTYSFRIKYILHRGILYPYFTRWCKFERCGQGVRLGIFVPTSSSLHSDQTQTYNVPVASTIHLLAANISLLPWPPHLMCLLRISPTSNRSAIRLSCPRRAAHRPHSVVTNPIAAPSRTAWGIPCRAPVHLRYRSYGMHCATRRRAPVVALDVPMTQTC